MPSGLKALLVGLALLFSSGALAIVSMFVIAVTAGRTIAAGERAAMTSGAIDIFLALVGTLAFVLLNRRLKLPWLLLATALFAVCLVGMLAAIFLVNLVLLNR